MYAMLSEVIQVATYRVNTQEVFSDCADSVCLSQVSFPRQPDPDKTMQFSPPVSRDRIISTFPKVHSLKLPYVKYLQVF